MNRVYPVRRRIRRIMPIVLPVLVLAGCSQPSDEWSVDLTVPVTVQPVSRGTIESVITVTGTLRAQRRAQLITEARGQLLLRAPGGSAELTEGMQVAAGDTLFQLVNLELEVGARLQSRQLALATARRTLEEQEVLLERGLTVEPEVEVARKTLVDAETEYQNALIQLGKVHGVTPIGGLVTGLTVITPGTLVEQGISVCTVMDYDRVIVDLQIPSAYLRVVDHASPVRVSNHAYQDEIFDGRITSLDPAVDPTTRTFQVRATVANADLLLRPGMFVKTEVITARRADVVVVPRDMVLTRQNRQVVFVVEAARAQMREVETGLEDQTHIEIVSGLEVGEQLIISNHQTLRARTRVQVTHVQALATGRR